MKTVLILGLLGVAGYAFWQYRKSPNAAAATQLSGAGGSLPTGAYEPPGVNSYTATAAPNKQQQLYAFAPSNPDAVTQPGYSPAFGAMENQPSDSESILGVY